MRDFEENGQDEKDLFEGIERIYINLKPQKEDYMSSPFVESLDKNIGKKEKPLIDSITKENRIIPLSKASEKEREQHKIELQDALSGVNLSEKEESLLHQRFSKDGIISYQKIGDENNFSQQYTQNLIKGALLKIKISNNALDSDTKKLIDEFSLEFNLKPKEAQKAIP